MAAVQCSAKMSVLVCLPFGVPAGMICLCEIINLHDLMGWLHRQVVQQICLFLHIHSASNLAGQHSTG